MSKTNAILLTLSLVVAGSFSAPASATYQTAVFSSQGASDNFCRTHNCYVQFVADYKHDSPPRYYAIYNNAH